jgi:DNA ligase-1
LEASAIPGWLFEESYHVVGDLAETMALLMPAGEGSSSKTLTEWINEINSLGDKTEEQRKEWLINSWAMLDTQERFVFNKLLTGSFRVGVSQSLVIKALADVTGIPAPALTHRLMGSWMPDTYTYVNLRKNNMQAMIYRAHILSFWLTLYRKHQPYKNHLKNCKARWAMLPIGRPSGNGTASARN